MKLVLGALQVAMDFLALDRRILHLAGLDLVQQIGVPDFRGLAPHASPALHYHVQHHQAHEYEHPEDDRLDRRIHQDPSFPSGGSPCNQAPNTATSPLDDSNVRKVTESTLALRDFGFSSVAAE